MAESYAENFNNKLEGISPISSEICIYKVPKRLRDGNEKAYTPQVVSLGPLHHGGEEGLEAMEDHKMRFVKDFFGRTNVNLKDCFKYLKEQEARIRSCYAVNIEFTEEKLVEMILVDGIFTVEFLLRSVFPTLQQESDRISGKPWIDKDITYDMLMLENQLPFFVLEHLHSLALASNTIPLQDNRVLCISELTHIFLQKWVYNRPFEEMREKIEHERPKHFVDFVLKSHLPSSTLGGKIFENLTIPSATELYRSGVKFQNVNNRNMFDIQFKNGVLKIPQLRIRGSTEIFFRNLIAYEQCEHRGLGGYYFNDYVFIIDRLVNTSKDVDLLVKSGIFGSKPLSSAEVARLINSLDSGPTLHSRMSYFTDLCEDLNRYYRVPWHQWKASLKQDYFSTPWAGLSIVAAAIVVVLTLIQTVCSVMSL